MTAGNSDVGGGLIALCTRGFRTVRKNRTFVSVAPRVFRTLNVFIFAQTSSAIIDAHETRAPADVRQIVLCRTRTTHAHTLARSPNVSRPCTRIPAAAAKCFCIVDVRVLCAALLDHPPSRHNGPVARDTGYRGTHNGARAGNTAAGNRGGRAKQFTASSAAAAAAK